MTDPLTLLTELVAEVAALRSRVDELEREQEHTSSPWLSVADGADYLGVSEPTLQRMILRRRLRTTTIGRRRLIHRDELDAVATVDVAPTTPRRGRRRRLAGIGLCRSCPRCDGGSSHGSSSHRGHGPATT